MKRKDRKVGRHPGGRAVTSGENSRGEKTRYKGVVRQNEARERRTNGLVRWIAIDAFVGSMASPAATSPRECRYTVGVMNPLDMSVRMSP